MTSLQELQITTLVRFESWFMVAYNLLALLLIDHNSRFVVKHEHIDITTLAVQDYDIGREK